MKLERELIGSGPSKVVILHDWTSAKDSWAGCRDSFDTERFSYALIELRGYGASQGYEGKFTGAEAAEDIVETVEALGWKQFHLVGHSMTGVPCQLVARMASARLKSLVLITPIPAGGIPVDAEGRALFESVATSDEGALTVTRMLTSARLPSAWYRDKLKRQRSGVSPAATLGYLDMWTREDVTSKVGTLETPTLVLVGAHDFEFFSLENLRVLIGKTIPGAIYEVLDDASHYPMAEVPLRTVRLIEDFMAEHS